MLCSVGAQWIAPLHCSCYNAASSFFPIFAYKQLLRKKSICLHTSWKAGELLAWHWHSKKKRKPLRIPVYMKAIPVRQRYRSHCLPGVSTNSQNISRYISMIYTHAVALWCWLGSADVCLPTWVRRVQSATAPLSPGLACATSFLYFWWTRSAQDWPVPPGQRNTYFCPTDRPLLHVLPRATISRLPLYYIRATFWRIIAKHICDTNP